MTKNGEKKNRIPHQSSIMRAQFSQRNLRFELLPEMKTTLHLRNCE